MVRREEPPSYADCGRGVAFSYPPGKPHHQPVPAAHLFSVPPPVARLNPPTLYSNPAHRSQPITPAPCPPRSSSYPAGKPPTAPPANIPTSQQVEKLASWHTPPTPETRRGSRPPPSAANPTTLHPAFLRSPYPGVNLKTTPCTHPLHPNPAPNLPPPAPSITCERTLHPPTLHQAH